MRKFGREVWITVAMILIASIVAVVMNRLIAGIYCMAAGTVIFLFAWFVPVFDIRKRWMKEALLVLNACMGYFLVEFATGNLLTVTPDSALINILFIYVFQKLLETIIGGYTVTCILTLAVCLFIGMAEYYIMRFRGSPIVPWDLMVLDTAATVFDDYSFHYPKEMYLTVMIFVAFSAFVMKFRFPEQQKASVRRVQNGLVTLAGVLVLYFGVYPNLETAMWKMVAMYEEQGFIASFVGNMVFMENKAPEGYSEEYVLSVLDGVEEVEFDAPVQAQNIIVVMNESYSDFRLINDKLVSDEFMPKWDARKNTIKGTVNVPIFGAGTCDTEFEALTGMSTKYTGSYPYVLKVNYETDSLARHLAAEGFDTLGYHPYYAANWRRTWVYPMFGFDHFYGIEHTSNIDYLRWKVRDDCNYENVIEYEENSAAEKFFAYNVTMQNHGGYSEPEDDLVRTVDLSHVGSPYGAVTYLSLVKLSDQALDELITYYEQKDEPTLICMFGDHQPKIEEEYYEALFGKPLTELTQEEQLMRFKTPVMFWANYDLPDEDLGDISTNYLAPLVMKYAGYDLDSYYSFLMQLKEKYPILNQNAVIDASGHILTEEEQAADQSLKDYQMLCYYLINGGQLTY